MKKAPIIIATAAANLKNQNLKQQNDFFINNIQQISFTYKIF